MFTGLIQTQGVVNCVDAHEHGIRLGIDLGALPVAELATGESIAVSGVCLTLTRLQGATGYFDVSTETLGVGLIANWRDGQRVNLERALTPQSPLGGHLLSGHVDGVAGIQSVQRESTFSRIRFAVGDGLGQFIAVKGSVAIDGVSLTVNSVRDCARGDTEFVIMLVPHTLDITSLGALKTGDRVHIEVDQLARYIQRAEAYRSMFRS